MISLCRKFASSRSLKSIIRKCHAINNKTHDLPPMTPLTDSTIKAWVEFENEGAGEKIKDYYREDVQEILKSLIGRNPKFLKHSYLPKSPVLPDYLLVRPEKLDDLNFQINKILNRNLLIVPMYTARKDNMNTTIQESPELSGYDTCKYVFTDTSLSKTKRTRTIVIRHPDGALRQACWDVRDRVEIVYFGDDGNVYPFPKFITDVNVLMDALTLDHHLYILNSVLCICEPDDKNYINAFKIIFDDIIQNNKYNLLEFSPFYGPLMYYAIVEEKFKNVISHYLGLIKMYNDESQVDYPIFIKHFNIHNYMKLYTLLKPQSQTAIQFKETNDLEQTIKLFLQELAK